MGQVATEPHEVVVNSFVEVRGDALVVNVKKREKASMFVPTMKIPLDHVLGAEADPEIERRLWRAWVLRSSTPGAYGGPDPDVVLHLPREGIGVDRGAVRGERCGEDPPHPGGERGTRDVGANRRLMTA